MTNGMDKMTNILLQCTCQPWYLYMQDNLTQSAGFHLLLQDNTAWQRS